MSSEDLLSQYYTTTYLENCEIAQSQYSHRLLEDPTSFADVSMILYILFIPLHVFVFYCIIYKTPSNIKNFKYELLSFHIFAAFCDHIMNSAVVGYIFFPKFVGQPMGWLTYLNPPKFIYGYLGQISVSFLASSIVILFECRYRAIVMNRFVMRRHLTRILFIGTNFIFAMVFLIPCFAKWPEDQQAEKLKFLEDVPCPTPIFFDDVVLVAIEDSQTIVMFYCSIIFFFVIFFQVQFFAISTSYYMFFTVNIRLSEKTRRLQKRIFFSLCAQVSIPTLTLFIPVAYLFVRMKENKYDQVINNRLYLFFGSHGIVSSICTILIYDSYRLVLFCAKRKKEKHASKLSNVRHISGTVKVSG